MPTFLLPGVTVQAVNSIGNGNHLRMSVTAGRYTVPMVYFGMSVKQFPFSIGDHIDVACALSINDFNDQRTVSVRVINVHPTGWRQGENLAGVYRYLRDNSPIKTGTDGMYYILRKKLDGYTYFKHLAALQIMRELDLMEDMQPEGFVIKNGEKKVELEHSQTFRRLQKG